MKNLFLCVVWAGTLIAQSISVTKPAPNDVLSGWSGYYFQVSLSSAPSVVKVCYTVDAYPAFNPGIDAPAAVGCSMNPPFRYPYNTFWNLNGPHQVIAAAYDALGNVVATSPAVQFSTSNNSPNPDSPSMTIATSTGLGSNWSGAVTVTPTLSSAHIPGDSLSISYYVDGLLQSTVTTSGNGSAAPGTINTTQFQNGPHVVGLSVIDKTTGTTWNIDGTNTLVGDSGEWTRTVTFANGAAASQALLNAHEIYLMPGGSYGGTCDVAPSSAGSCTLSAQIQNTDGSTTASTPVFEVADPTGDLLGAQGTGFYMSGSLPGNALSLRNLASGVATVNSSGLVTATANGAALVSVMTPIPAFTMTDLAIGSVGNNQVTSVSHSFTIDETGWLLNVTGGTCIHGTYQISLAQGTLGAFVGNQPVGASGVTGCTATVGPTRQAWVYVWPTHNASCYGQDGSIQSSYTSNCMFVSSLFGAVNQTSLLNITGDQPYSPGAAADLNASGFHVLEAPIYSTFLTGTETPTQFSAGVASAITSITSAIAGYSNLRILTIGSTFFWDSQELWALAYGNESNPTYIASQTGLQYAITQMEAAGVFLGDSTIDEITGHWGGAPLQGSLTFSNSGTTQSGLQSITGFNSGTCAATVNNSAPTIYPIGNSKFVIRGSGGSGDPSGSLNSAAPATYAFSKPSGASATAAVSGRGSTITVTVTGAGSNYYIAPQVNLYGGGGTYSSATATVDTTTGHVTGVTVSGASGYVSAPSVAFFSNSFVFACSGVANGTYNASNDSGLIVEPYGNAWYNSNTQVAYYDVWAKARAQENAVPSRHFFFQNPAVGTAPQSAFANWSGNTSYPQAQSISPTNSVADSGDFYWPFSPSPYIASRLSANGLLTTYNQGYWLRSRYGGYDPSKPFTEEVEATTGYSGWQGYRATVVSCVGNTITFSAPHGITNILQGAARLWITGATDSGSPRNSCNDNYTILAAPTPTTLTVLSGSTDFTCNSGCPTTSSSGSNGGTVHFADGSTVSLTGISAVGSPTGNGAGNRTPAGVSISGFLGGDRFMPATFSSTIYRERGNTFTLAGVSGTPTSNSHCLAGGCTSWTTPTFMLLPENLNWASVYPGQTQGLFFREIPSLNATGGTATILPDWNYHKGFSGQQSLSDLNPGWAFGSMMECLLHHCEGWRAYTLTPAPNGYWDQIGFTLAQTNLTQYSSNVVNTQTIMNQHFENGSGVPTFHAMSNAGLIANRLAKFLLQPALNAPDCGFLVECAAARGTPGNVFFAFNASDGPQTKIFTLTPYETSGQNIIRWVVNDHSISGATSITAGTATDTVTLQPEDAVFYVFPIAFAGELQQPPIAARLADVNSATKIVVRYAYDRYYLDSTISNAYDCGMGACTPPWDRNIGTVYYRLIYLAANSTILATSDVQTF